MIIKRTMSADIIEAAKYFPVVALLGPRQSGKTTLAQQTFSHHTYVNFEDAHIRAFAESDPHGFLKEYRNEYGIIIDEFQNAPDFLSYIQLDVDKNKQPGYFILTGSQNFLMNQAITQTLAGRISIHTLLPLSITELKKSELLPTDVEILLQRGSYPALWAKQIPSERWYPSYIQTYLERDVRQLQAVENLNLFQKFVQLCAGRIGQVLNYTALGNDCGISDMTVRRWLSILEASYIIFLLRPHHENFNKRLTKSPKIYFYDTGIVCSLLRISPEQVATHYLKGSLFENLIIADFYKQYYNKGIIPHIYFWRDQTGHEVDCLLDEGFVVKPIEIKAAQTISHSFFTNLSYWNDLAQADPKNSYLIYTGTEDQHRSKGTVLTWQHTEAVMK